MLTRMLLGVLIPKNSLYLSQYDAAHISRATRVTFVEVTEQHVGPNGVSVSSLMLLETIMTFKVEMPWSITMPRALPPYHRRCASK